MTTVNGLPAHILLVHAIVVLLPLSALVLVLTACLPSVRRRLTGANAILSVLVVILVPITTNAGEWLERRVARTPLVRAHTEIGDTAIWAAIPVAVLALALWWRQREAGASGASAVSAGAAAAGSSVAAVTGADAGAAVPGGPAVPSGVDAATGGGAAAAKPGAGGVGSGRVAAAGAGVPGSGGAAAGASGATSARGGVGAPGSAGADADAAVSGGSVVASPEAAASGVAAAGARQAGPAVSGASASKAAANRRVFLAPASKAVSVTLIVLSILAAGAAVYDIVRIGDTGAQASWQGQFQQNPAPRGR
ncbi:hypothetical protein ACFXPA_18100 [Amycolatopsis sp. NPDC059090]|uniref:hypothetical protein n=1 Tax=unclassified Amycolatopsis TaxID=2618356 RepID=UPI00366C399B